MGVGNLPCTSQSLQGRPIATRSRCPWSGGDPSVVSLLPSHPCCSCHPECPIHPVSPTVPWWPRLLFCCEMPTRDQFSSRWRGRVDETLTTVPRRLVRLDPSKNYVFIYPSQHQNLPPTLEILIRNFSKFSKIFKISKKFPKKFQNFEFFFSKFQEKINFSNFY